MTASEQRIRDSIEKHRAGEFDDAERGYFECLREDPADPTALHFLGLMRHQQNRTLEGIRLMEAAIDADPAYVDAWSNLGIAYLRQRDFQRSKGCCRNAIGIAPEFVNAWCTLGFALREEGELDEALSTWERALALRPNMSSIAIPYGRLLYKMNRIDAARAFYEKWAHEKPDDPVAAHMVAAMSAGTAPPERASDDYVRTTFDDFADSFDFQLEGLKYRAPQILCEAAKAEFPSARDGALTVLDLGCGTGLCGPLFGSIARRLVGVDLSRKMLAKAAARGCYQQLNLSELSTYLRDCKERFDVVVAADVLCYFGSLAESFEGVRRVLTPNGRFLFSLEDARNSGGDANEGYVLKPHGRYEHQRNYVESALESAGLQVVGITNETLRFERGDPVIGLIAIGALLTEAK